MWIDPKERMPDSDEHVLFVLGQEGDYEVFLGGYTPTTKYGKTVVEKHWWVYSDCCRGSTHTDVWAWMPLPEYKDDN